MTRRTRLAIQPLEARDAPSGVGDSTVTGPAPTDVVAVDGRRNAAPVITDFRAIVGPNGQVTFSGRVSDDQAVAGYVVRITGNGVDVSATVLKDGTFRVTTVVTGPADVMVTAQTMDGFGLRSDPVYTTFSPSA